MINDNSHSNDNINGDIISGYFDNAIKLLANAISLLNDFAHHCYYYCYYYYHCLLYYYYYIYYERISGSSVYR